MVDAGWGRAIAQNLISNVVWGVLALALGALAWWLASLTPVINLFAPFSYLVAVLVAMMFASITGYFLLRIWRHFVPVRAPGNESTSAERAALSEEFRKLSLSVSGLYDIAIEAKDTATALRSAYASETAGTKEAIEGLQQRFEAMVNQSAINAANIVGVQGELAALKGEVASVDDRIDARLKPDMDAIRGAFQSVNLSFEAVWHRERLQRLAEEIEQNAEVLSKPTNDHSSIMDEAAFEGWTKSEEEWRDSIKRWCELAGLYRKDIYTVVFDLPEAAYRGRKWNIKDAQFPAGSDAIHAYKSFRLIYKNWQESRVNVDRRVWLAAFNDQSLAMRGGERD